MWVTLNEAEQRLAKFLAAARNKANRDRNTENRRLGPQSDEQTDLEGVAAEIAFCKIVNVYPDMSTTDGAPVADAFCFGMSVDVKVTKYENGRLLVVPWKVGKGGVDLYALMIGEFPRYRLAGVKRAKEVLLADKLTDLGYGPSYAVTQSELDDWRGVISIDA